MAELIDRYPLLAEDDPRVQQILAELRMVVNSTLFVTKAWRERSMVSYARSIASRIEWARNTPPRPACGQGDEG